MIFVVPISMGTVLGLVHAWLWLAAIILGIGGLGWLGLKIVSGFAHWCDNTGPWRIVLSVVGAVLGSLLLLTVLATA